MTRSVKNSVQVNAVVTASNELISYAEKFAKVADAVKASATYVIEGVKPKRAEIINVNDNAMLKIYLDRACAHHVFQDNDTIIGSIIVSANHVINALDNNDCSVAATLLNDAIKNNDIVSLAMAFKHIDKIDFAQQAVAAGEEYHYMFDNSDKVYVRDVDWYANYIVNVIGE